MSERLSSRNKLKVSAVATVAALTLSACAGESKQDSWVFSVDCGDGQLDVIEIEDKSFEEKVTLECEDGGDPFAPESIELLSGTGITIDDDGLVSNSLLTINYDYVEGGLSPMNPRVELVEIKDATAVITMDEVTITGVTTEQ